MHTKIESESRKGKTQMDMEG